MTKFPHKTVDNPALILYDNLYQVGALKRKFVPGIQQQLARAPGTNTGFLSGFPFSGSLHTCRREKGENHANYRYSGKKLPPVR